MRALVRAAAWHRRPLAVLAAVAAVLCLSAALSPAPEATVPVVVAARDLDGGQALAEADLRVAHYPTALAPAGAPADPASLTGRALIAGAMSGTPITVRSVVAPRETAAGVGRVMVPLRLDDPAVVGLLRVGDVLDILATSTDGSSARPIASAARVLALPLSEDSGPLGVPSTSSGRLVLIEVTPTDANRVIEAQARDRLAVTLR